MRQIKDLGHQNLPDFLAGFDDYLSQFADRFGDQFTYRYPLRAGSLCGTVIGCQKPVPRLCGDLSK
jgi:hypothetical protein